MISVNLGHHEITYEEKMLQYPRIRISNIYCVFANARPTDSAGCRYIFSSYLKSVLLIIICQLQMSIYIQFGFLQLFSYVLIICISQFISLEFHSLRWFVSMAQRPSLSQSEVYQECFICESAPYPLHISLQRSQTVSNLTLFKYKGELLVMSLKNVWETAWGFGRFSCVSVAIVLTQQYNVRLLCITSGCFNNPYKSRVQFLVREDLTMLYLLQTLISRSSGMQRTHTFMKIM